MYIVVACLLSLIYVWIVYNVPILVAGVRNFRRVGKKKKKALFSKRKGLPKFSILVPVKNEEKVIGRILNALLNLDYPPKKKEVVIVEDGSTDKTVEICATYAERYHDQIKLFRRPVSNGKPSALNYALKHTRGEIVAVFDADNVPESDILLRAAEHFEDPSIAAVQGRTLSINADENRLTKLLSYEEAARFEAFLRGKDAFGLYVPLAGSCQFIRREVLENVGGWDEGSLTEDVEMSITLMEKGYRVKYASDLRSWQENPADLTQLVGQRIRWYRGWMEVALKYGKLMLRLGRNNIDTEITLAGPFMLPLCLLGYLFSILAFVFPFDPISGMMIRVTTLLNVAILFVLGLALISVTKKRKATDLLWLPYIYVYWSLQVFVASLALLEIILRRPRSWKKTLKKGTVINRALKRL